MRLLLPATRCALTAPFHPYLINEAVCSLWHFPWASLQASRPAGVTRHPCFVEPGLSSRFLRTPRLPGPLAGRDVGDGGRSGKVRAVWNGRSLTRQPPVTPQTNRLPPAQALADSRASWISQTGEAVAAASRVARTHSYGTGRSNLIPIRPSIDQTTSPNASKPSQQSMMSLLPSGGEPSRQQPRCERLRSTARSSANLEISLARKRVRKRDSFRFPTDNASTFQRFSRSSSTTGANLALLVDYA